MSFLLAWNTWLVGGLTVVFLIVCVMMILTVLIQRPQGGGLSGAFGSGAGSGQTAFGAKTGDALTIFTIIVFVLFLGFGIALNYGYRPPRAEDSPRVLKTSVTTSDGESKTQEGDPGKQGQVPISAPETSGSAAPGAGNAASDKAAPPVDEGARPAADTPAAPGSAPSQPPADPAAPASSPK